MFKAVCKLGFEGDRVKKLGVPDRSGRLKSWIEVRNPKASAVLACRYDALAGRWMR